MVMHYRQEGQLLSPLLGRFAAAVQQSYHHGTLELYRLAFDHRTDPEVAFLLGTVLRSHPNLARIKFAFCHFTSYECVDLLTNSLMQQQSRAPDLLSSSSNRNCCFLQELSLFQTQLDYQGGVAIANLLRSNSANKNTLQRLYIGGDSCRIDSAACQAIFEALDGNKHLKELHLRDGKISEISRAGAKALANSSLCVLHVNRNPWSDRGIQTLEMLGLRSNTSLQHLHISRPRSLPLISSDLFEDLLTTFNFTLRVVQIVDWYPTGSDHLQYQPRVIELLRLNESVRKVANELEPCKRNFQYAALGDGNAFLWPQALALVSSKPSLIYKFLRQIHLDSFTMHVTHHAVLD